MECNHGLGRRGSQVFSGTRAHLLFKVGSVGFPTEAARVTGQFRTHHTSLWEKLCHAVCAAGWLCPDLGEVCPGHVSRRLVLTCKEGGKAERVGTVLETTGLVPPHQGECSRRNFLGT